MGIPHAICRRAKPPLESVDLVRSPRFRKGVVALVLLLSCPGVGVFGARSASVASADETTAPELDVPPDEGEVVAAEPSQPAPPPSEDRTGLREAGFRVGYGYSTRRDIQVIPFYAHAGWLFPDVIDEPLARHGFDLEYVVEGWIGGVTGPQNAIEVGVNPVGFKISYDVGQTVVPYFGGALGVL